jgi:UPF0271 protein
MGESTSLFAYDIEKDIALMSYLSSVNLACGYHAGDAHTMHRLVETAMDKRIAIGAHPSYPDRENFGRTDIVVSTSELYDMVLYQLGALYAFVKVKGGHLHHVKPHGALYNMAAKDRLLADAICKAMVDFDRDLILYGLSGSELIHAAKDMGLKAASEIFSDRTYQDDGSLTSRNIPGALIEDEQLALKQVMQLVTKGTVNTLSGKNISLEAETICIHGDGKHALEFARKICKALPENGINIKPV